MSVFLSIKYLVVVIYTAAGTHPIQNDYSHGSRFLCQKVYIHGCRASSIKVLLNTAAVSHTKMFIYAAAVHKV